MPAKGRRAAREICAIKRLCRFGGHRQCHEKKRGCRAFFMNAIMCLCSTLWRRCSQQALRWLAMGFKVPVRHVPPASLTCAPRGPAFQAKLCFELNMRSRVSRGWSMLCCRGGKRQARDRGCQCSWVWSGLGEWEAISRGAASRRAFLRRVRPDAKPVADLAADGLTPGSGLPDLVAKLNPLARYGSCFPLAR